MRSWRVGAGGGGGGVWVLGKEAAGLRDGGGRGIRLERCRAGGCQFEPDSERGNRWRLDARKRGRGDWHSSALGGGCGFGSGSEAREEGSGKSACISEGSARCGQENELVMAT